MCEVCGQIHCNIVEWVTIVQNIDSRSLLSGFTKIRKQLPPMLQCYLCPWRYCHDQLIPLFPPTHHRYDKKKGFYCASRGSRPRCLGPSKGRHYPAMSESDRDFLRSYYIPHNRKLSHTLSELSRTPPQWLSSLTWCIFVPPAWLCFYLCGI